MDRSQQVAKWLKRKWRAGSKGAIFLDIRRYRVVVMLDHNDPDVWTWVINTPDGDHQWSDEKYDTEEDTKKAALEGFADILGL